MSRQIKTVSIPDRLRNRVASIENFSGFVVAAIENPDQAMAAERIAALHRQITARKEDLIFHLETIAVDLQNISMSRNPAMKATVLKRAIQQMVQELKEDL